MFQMKFDCLFCNYQTFLCFQQTLSLLFLSYSSKILCSLQTFAGASYFHYENFLVDLDQAILLLLFDRYQVSYDFIFQGQYLLLNYLKFLYQFFFSQSKGINISLLNFSSILTYNGNCFSDIADQFLCLIYFDKKWICSSFCFVIFSYIFSLLIYLSLIFSSYLSQCSFFYFQNCSFSLSYFYYFAFFYLEDFQSIMTFIQFQCYDFENMQGTFYYTGLFVVCLLIASISLRYYILLASFQKCSSSYLVTFFQGNCKKSLIFCCSQINLFLLQIVLSSLLSGFFKPYQIQYRYSFKFVNLTYKTSLGQNIDQFYVYSILIALIMFQFFNYCAYYRSSFSFLFIFSVNFFQLAAFDSFSCFLIFFYAKQQQIYVMLYQLFWIVQLMNYIRLNIFIYYMKQAKQGLVTVQKEGLTLTMSIVQKESNSGLLYNQRLFVLNQGHFFGYISKFKLTDDPNKINLINVKSSVPIKFIKSIQSNQDVLTIKFLQQNQLKIAQKSWLLKMANEKMVQEWYKKLQEEKAKKTHRSNSKKSRDSKQKQESANKNQNKESASKILIITNENKHTKSQTHLQQNKEINKNQTGSTSMMNNINNQKSSPQIKKTQISQKQQQKQKQKLLRQRQRQKQIYQRERQKQKGKDRQKQRQKIQINNQHQEVEQFVNPLYTGYDSVQQQANMRNKETKKPQEKTVKKTQKLQKKQKEKESLFMLNKVQEQEDGVYVNKYKKSNIQTKKQEIKSEIDNQNDPTNSRFFKESKQNQLYRQPKSKQPQQRFANNPHNISQSKNNPKQKLFEKQIKEPIIIQDKQPLSLIKKTNVSIKDQSNYMEMISKLVADSNKKSKQSIQFMYGQTEQLKRKYNLSEDVQQLQKDPEQKKRLQIVHEYALNLQKQNMRNELRNKMFQKNIKVSNENLSLSIEDMPWSYRYLVNDSPDTSSAFRRYSQQILKKIVDQFPQNQAKTNFKPKIKKNNILIYNFQECQIKIALIVLKQISTKGQNKQTREERICDYTSHKQLQVQYKNYCALNFYIQNKSKLKVPLICLTQYNGFLALFKINSKFSHHNVIDQNLIQKQQKQITNLSKIQTDFTSSNSKFLVMKIDQKYYRELDESFKLMKSFDYHIVQEVDDFLIHDFLSKSNPNLILRRELLEQQKMNQAQITYKNIRADKIKSSNNINKTDITKIQNLSKKVLQNISSFIICLDNLSFYFLHPKQLSENIHKYGINMRYLGLIYDNTTLKFSKINIMTQIAARACKLLLRKTQQDLYLEKSESGFFTQQDLLFKMMDFLNCIVGNTYQTVAIWKVLSFHSQFYFKIPINLQQIQKGLFLICLSYHCNLIFQWSKINPNEVFKTNDFFTSQNLLSLGTKAKCYEPIHNEKYRKTLDLMNEQTQENFNEIATILNLHQNNIPSYFLQHNKQVKIKKYLAHFIQPTSILNTNSFPHLHIFQTSEVISKDEFDIALMEIKWYFRQNKKDKYIKCCEAIVSKVNKYFGDFHPVLNQIYDLFSNYHINKSQYEDGTTFAKSSLVNILKICGTNHQKTSQCYFNLAMCYIKSNKKDEALNLLKKSKLIFQNNQKTQTTPYAVINLKMGLLYLNQSNIDQCIKCAQLSLSIFTNPQEDTKKLTTYEDQTTQAYQLLSRCFQLKKSKQNLKKLGQKCEKILSKIISPSNLQRAMKIILYPLLSTMPTADASLYLDILSMIPLQITTKSYGRSFGLLKIRIKQDSLVENLKNYLQNIQSIDKFISENQTLKNWRPSQKLYQRQTVNDFIALSQQFLYFLGEGFMTGSLRQAL